MKRILWTLFLLLPVSLSAQETFDDGLAYGARTSVEADAKLAPGLHLSAHEEVRYYFNTEDIIRFHTGIGLEYKVLPFLKAGAEYEFINRCKYDSGEEANGWSVRHRGNFFVTGTLKTPDWQFGIKETFRMTYRPGDMNLYQAPRTALALKSKASVKYLGLGIIIPYAAFEVRNTLNDVAYSAFYVASAKTNKDRYRNESFLGYKHAYVNRLRAQLGVTFKFSKHHELDLYLLGDHLKDKSVDTNREGSVSWKENGLVLKSIDWHVGNMVSACVGYKWSF